MLSEQKMLNYEDLYTEFMELESSLRDRAKVAKTSTQTRLKRRTDRKRGTPAPVVGMPHRRLHRLSW